MNAIEFVKKFGFESAVKVLKSAPVSATSYRVSENNQLGLGGLYGRVENINGCILSLCDLKQIVDAFDFVMEHGSVEHAKKYAESDYTAPEVKQFLLKAINLVGQCNA